MVQWRRLGRVKGKPPTGGSGGEKRRVGARQNEEDESSTVPSVKSDASHETSPVLSTTTLQTTPSPPPSNAAESKDTKEPVPSDPPMVETVPPQWPIAIGLNLNPPQLLHSIPLIPETLGHLPQYSRETFISVRIRTMRFFYLHRVLIASCQVWREAMISLYHCRCKICERAIQTGNTANGMSTAPVAATTENTNADAVPPVVVQSPPITHSTSRDSPRAASPHRDRGRCRTGARGRGLPGFYLCYRVYDHG